MRVLKLATARDVLIFMASSTDHISGATGLTLTITASKAAGALASITPTVTERSDGWYKLALTATHTDTLGDFALHITSAGADPTDVMMQVVAYDPSSAPISVTATSPIVAAGSITDIVPGDDYFSADGRSWDRAFSGLSYTLVGATVVMGIRVKGSSTNALSLTGAVLTASSIRFEPTSAETILLKRDTTYDYDMQATLSGTSHVTTLETGTLTTVENLATP